MPPPPRRRPAAALALAILAAGATLAATAQGAPHVNGPGTGCGGVLWRLMTLSDPGRMHVQLHNRTTTIASIAALHGPARIAPSRATAFQRQVWKLHTVVDRYRIASNGEIVMSIYSIDSAQYMNVYLPNPHCLGGRARDRTGMIAARRELVSHCPPVTAAWQLLGITVDIAGAGFWNPSTATRGALRNGAELRPLTNFKIVSGCGVG
jgi:hypothetical protein